MTAVIEEIKDGSITSPRGFIAGAAEAGIKYAGRQDLAILFSEKPCSAAAVFTSNRVKAAPVLVSMKHIAGAGAKAVVVNSGCANACTGDKGLEAAREMAGLTAKKTGIPIEQVLVASTGVIGTEIPMDRVKKGIAGIRLSSNGGHDLAGAIMTTDTKPKEIALKVKDKTGDYIIAGVAKGSGMIHPDMATLLSFLTTDAKVEAAFLSKALKRAVDCSFNMITVDGDTSTNDMVSIMANGAAGNKEIGQGNGKTFQEALKQVCGFLARSLVSDAEGATKIIEVAVEGAKSNAEAKKIGRTIAGSALLKSAVHGNDPNWGRIVAALGRSGAYFEEGKLDVTLQDNTVMQGGRPVGFDKNRLSELMKSEKVTIKLRLNIGRGNAVAWGCDLSEEYVTINSDYTS